MPSPPQINLPPITGPSKDECDYILGAYMRRWGNVEIAMASLIRKLLDTDMTTAQIVIRALQNMQAQRELALELGKHRLKNTTDVKTLDKLMDRVKSAATRRNRIVHGTWTVFLEMPPKPAPKPLTAKSAKWVRRYDPVMAEDQEKLMTRKSQKLAAAYEFCPEQIVEDANRAVTLSKDIEEFTKSAPLKPPRIPLPVEW